MSRQVIMLRHGTWHNAGRDLPDMFCVCARQAEGCWISGSRDTGTSHTD